MGGIGRTAKGGEGQGRSRERRGGKGMEEGKDGKEWAPCLCWVKFAPLSASWIECATVWDLVSRLTPRTYVN